MHATIWPASRVLSAVGVLLDGRRVPSPVVRMTEPTARELIDLNTLASPNSRLGARPKSAFRAGLAISLPAGTTYSL
jgi:hypothetical protein